MRMLAWFSLVILAVLASSCLTRRLNDTTSSPYHTNDTNRGLKTRQQTCEEAQRVWRNETCIDAVAASSPQAACESDVAKVWDAKAALCIKDPQAVAKQRCLAKKDGSQWLAGNCLAAGGERAIECEDDKLWDGERCVVKSEPFTFYQYCLQGESTSSEVKQTVAVLHQLTSKATCQEAYIALRMLPAFYLSGKKIVSLLPFYGLRNIVTLVLGDNEIRDITPLQFLPNIMYLDLMANELTDLSPLAGLLRLEHLFLNRNPITNVTPLRSLTKLTDLDLSLTLLGSTGTGGVAKTRDNCPITNGSEVLMKFCRN